MNIEKENFTRTHCVLAFLHERFGVCECTCAPAHNKKACVFGHVVTSENRQENWLSVDV